MTEKDMNKLADIIISKLEIKQQQWDDEFHDSIADIYGKEGHKEAFIMSEEEMLIGELARLQTILMIFENIFLEMFELTCSVQTLKLSTTVDKRMLRH